MGSRPVGFTFDPAMAYLSGTTPRVTQEDPYTLGAGRRRTRVRMESTDWVTHFIKIKDGDTGLVSPLVFDERKYLKRIYNTPSRKILLMTSRQTEKSTSIGNKIMAFSNMRALYTSLFVSPTALQTMVFSKARLDDIVEISPLLRAMKHTNRTWNLMEKEWVNRSKIYLRYAFLTADRIRGLSVNAVFADELQDFLRDLMPVIEETASHHRDPVFVYSGTPKSFDNTIEEYWSKHSTQSEWCIPCERHGTPKSPSSWHWVVLGPKNIGKTGPVCDRCGSKINPTHPYARWVEMNPNAEWEGYRICRLMVPWYQGSEWKRILEVQKRYPTAQFMNEVMALSYDSGAKPLTRTEVIRVCDPTQLMDENRVAQLGARFPLYGGVDWGTGEHSYTVLFVGGYTRDDDRFQIVYAKRFDGPLIEPDPQMEELIRLINRFRLKFVGADYGMGFHPNKRLTSIYSAKKIHQFQYVARSPAKVKYQKQIARFTLFRTPVMADVFNAIKAGKIRFPSYEVFKSPFAEDMLNIRAEYSNTLRMLQYDHPRGLTDDSFHALLYCLLASFFDRRRPDIMAPIRETGDAAAASHAEDMLMEDMDWSYHRDGEQPP